MTLPRAFGPYTLTTRLAVGGMAEVYVAKTQGLGGFEKQVALKLVHPHLAADGHFVRMLIDEAKVLVRLNHANIAQVLDLGRIGDDYYIAMEYVDGGDLHQILRSARALKRPLPPEMAAFVIAEVCSGLDYAHRKRDDEGSLLHLVHRDVSPQNILVSSAGEVKLVDFGIAKGTHRVEGTEVGVIKGKYNYMSPEQAWADPMDGRSDIFSAGIVLWEMLVGRMLYRSDDIPRLIAEVREADVPAPHLERGDVPEALSKLVTKATARDAADRFQSAADFGEALRDFVYTDVNAYNARKLSELLETLRVDHARAQPSPRAFCSVRSRDDLPAQRGSVLPDAPSSRPPPVVPKAPIAPQLLAPRPTLPRRFPSPAEAAYPLPDNSLPPRSGPMSGSDFPLVSRDTMPELAPPPAFDGPTLVSWSGARIADEQGADRTLVDGRGGLTEAASSLLDSQNSLGLGAPTLGPTFDSEPTSRYTGRHMANVVGSSRAARSSSYAMPPPASGEERIPEVPRYAPVPDIAAETRRLDRQRFRQNLFVMLGATVVSALGVSLVWEPAVPKVPVLELASVPSGATVLVDEQAAEGTTPLRLQNFETGQNYELKVEKVGYRSWQATYHAAPGIVQRVAVLEQVQAELYITTQPQGAALWIDGVRMGKAPLKVSALDAGRTVRVRASLRGYGERTVIFKVDPDELKPRISMQLKPLAGTSHEDAE